MAVNAAVSPQARRVLRLLGTLAPLTSVAVARALNIRTAQACSLLQQLRHAHLAVCMPVPAQRQRFVNQLRHEYHPSALGALLLSHHGTRRSAEHLIALSEAVDLVLHEPALLDMSNALPSSASWPDLLPQRWLRTA